MQLYIYISISVVVLSTAALFYIFHKKNLKDYRYHIGLAASAILATAGSLFFPDLMSALAVNLALQFILALFVAALLYIMILFLVMILVSSLVPKEKVDKLAQKWEEWRLARKQAKELKLKEKESSSAQSDQKDEKTKAVRSESAGEDTLKVQTPPVSSATEENKPKIAEELPPEPEKAIISETGLEQTETTEHEAQPIPSGTGAIKTEIAEELPPEPEKAIISEIGLEQTDITDHEVPPFSSEGVENKTITAEDLPAEPEEIGISEMDSGQNTSMDAPSKEPTTQNPEENNPMTADEGILGETEQNPVQIPDSGGIDELPEGEDLLEKAVSFLENSIEKEGNIEKNVDTSDIIDKMGLDATIDNTADVPDMNMLSLEESIEKAFSFKQEGRAMEAAALYMHALDLKPDTETAFWIVLDICIIYKAAGQSELAEDILLTYMDEFEDLMSEEVKDQILQSLY